MDHEERTVTHVACLKGSKKVIKELISLDADFTTVKDSRGHSPLEKASIYGHAQIANRLQ